MHIHTERKPPRACTIPTAQVLKWPGNFNFISIKVTSDGQSWPEVELTIHQAQAIANVLHAHEQAHMKRVTLTSGGAK